MKKTICSVFLVFAVFGSFERLASTQTEPRRTQSEQDKDRPKLIALKVGEPGDLSYDAGTVRFLASSEETHGGWSLVELREMPGYHTNLHRHNHTDEAFYVVEGVLTVRINDMLSDYRAGSYVLIPRGTAHAQGNRGKIPARILLTMTPGGFERSFRDRVELFKTAKPTDSDFRQKRKEIIVKGNYDVEFLADWSLPK